MQYLSLFLYREAYSSRHRAEEEEVGNRHVRGPIWSGFHFGWDAIQTWIGRPKQDHGMNQGDEKVKAGQRRTGPDEDREQLASSGPRRTVGQTGGFGTC